MKGVEILIQIASTQFNAPLTVQARTTSTIGNIKTIIQLKEGVHPQKQILHYQDAELGNGSVLSQLHIGDGSTIILSVAEGEETKKKSQRGKSKQLAQPKRWEKRNKKAYEDAVKAAMEDGLSETEAVNRIQGNKEDSESEQEAGDNDRDEGINDIGGDVDNEDMEDEEEDVEEDVDNREEDVSEIIDARAQRDVEEEELDTGTSPIRLKCGTLRILLIEEYFREPQNVKKMMKSLAVMRKRADLAADYSVTQDCILLPVLQTAITIGCKCTNPRCTANYKAGGNSGDKAGHRIKRFFGFWEYISNNFNQAGQVVNAQGLQQIIDQESTNSDMEWSHFCKAPATHRCIAELHSAMEPPTVNKILRKVHQNGREVCNCAEEGRAPCLYNAPGPYQPVKDGDGKVVKWERTEPEKEIISKKRKR